MKYVYGPVRSRRLGNSLGISTVPYKVCQFDCVYCQLKRTTVKTLRRGRYVDEKEILTEVENFFRHKEAGCRVDHIAFSGSGEPTLHRGIGTLIRAVKKMTALPVVVITNSVSLIDPAVRREVSAADIIIPSLDAVTQDVFEKVDRPAPGIRVRDIIDALALLRMSFKGKIWLEVMLVRGLNDAPEYLEKIKKVVVDLKPDRVQVNSPVRPPSENWVKPVSRATLKKACALFGPTCDII